jgi:hypothetical protein
MKNWKRTDWLVIAVMAAWTIGVLFIVINSVE